MATRHDAPTERSLAAWESWVDRAIRDAQERGEFSDLPGAGQPVHVDRNPLAGDQELGFHVLKNADVLPIWMERGREAAAGHAALDTFRERARERIAELQDRACRPPSQPAAKPGPAFLRWLRGGSPDWRAQPVTISAASAEQERRHLRDQYLERAAKVDRQIRAYNDALPFDLRWLERPRLLPTDASAQFDAACPPIVCQSDGTADRAASTRCRAVRRAR